MALTLLAAATGGGTSSDLAVRNGHTATLIASNLAGAETGSIQISYDGGTTFINLFSDGSQQQLTATNNTATVYGPGIFRVVKSATAGACGIFASVDWNL